MADVKAGVSKSVLVVGLIAAILASSLVSVVAMSQLSPTLGLKGDKGDKGDAGATGATGSQGLQGIQGPQGIQGQQGIPGEPSIAVASNASSTNLDLLQLMTAHGNPNADIPDMTVTITVNSTSCLFIFFSASASIFGDGIIQVKPILEGTSYQVSPPGLVTLMNQANIANVYNGCSYDSNFIVPTISPGTYTVKMQVFAMLYQQPNTSIDMNFRTIIVEAIPI